jgi:hypothetical protein
MPLTNQLKPVADFLEALLETNKGALGLQDVFYGDQNRIPRTPTACVDPGEKRRQLNGAPRRTQLDIVIYILVYHNAVTNVEVLAKTNDKLSEDIETVIHVDAQMGGLLIDSMVTNIEFGYASRGKTLYRVSRLTVEGRSQAQLPSSV